MPHFGTEFDRWTMFWVEPHEFCAKAAFHEKNIVKVIHETLFLGNLSYRS
jgi:hypothetical protein